MKFYFNCNNRTQAKALKDCGVKNILLSYQYCKEAFDMYVGMFEGIGVIPGKIDNVDMYYKWVNLNKRLCDFITQYDVPMDMDLTLKYFTKGERYGISPVLTVNYMQHLGLLNIHDGRTIVLGKMGGNIEEDEQVRRLPNQYDYHGLAKGRWKDKPNITSINSSTWLSGVVGRKSDVYKGTQILLGHKGRSELSTLQRILQQNKDNIESCSISPSQVMEGKYSELLKLPIALYYKPMLASLGASSQNFS